MTRLCQLLGIEVPIVQAPIGNASCPELVAAVCEAGALGMLSVTWRKLPEVRRVIREVQDRTARPFAADLVPDLMNRSRAVLTDTLDRLQGGSAPA